MGRGTRSKLAQASGKSISLARSAAAPRARPISLHESAHEALWMLSGQELLNPVFLLMAAADAASRQQPIKQEATLCRDLLNVRDSLPKASPVFSIVLQSLNTK